jgi:hypothetical protein
MKTNSKSIKCWKMRKNKKDSIKKEREVFDIVITSNLMGQL